MTRFHAIISFTSSKNSERSFIESTATRWDLKCNALGAAKSGERCLVEMISGLFHPKLIIYSTGDFLVPPKSSLFLAAFHRWSTTSG